ncbi:MAG: diguanylate cyclase, partial [Nitrospirae bacterium]|nr:diguanylate cyclase [Nitrospirota bacterium]
MSPSLQVIGLLGEHPFLARLARALRKQGWATRTLAQVSDVAANAEVAAFVISGDASAAHAVAEATDRPLVCVLDSPGAEDLQRLLDAGVDEVIDPAAVKPVFGALLVLKAIQVAERHAREAESARGVRAEVTEEELRDGLTGLYSKEMAERELVSLWQWAVRRRFPVSVVLFDVDHLKKLNETYGDEVGSRVVAAVGRYLKEMSRAADVIAHFGGGR